MIVARCPHCATTFRVTPEQLKVRAGKVRCGQCKTIFNALDALVDETSPAPLSEPPVTRPELPQQKPTIADDFGDKAAEIDTVGNDLPQEAAAPASTPSAAGAESFSAAASPEAAPAQPVVADAPAPDATDAAPAPDAALQEAQEAGLVAARDTREAPGYSKWAERPLAGGDAGFETPARSPRWPAFVFSLLLGLGLVAQLAHHFRGTIAARWPELRPPLLAACSMIGCEVPLPRQADLVSIEGSELQADPAHGGLLVLQASLKNRANFAQALPALELTLTDTQDKAVLRRVLSARDYLPPKSDASVPFGPGADLAVKLWIDAKDAGAAGYRLYVFYP